jgi:putative endonuclease
MNVPGIKCTTDHHRPHAHPPHVLGKLGEDEAVRYLLSSGYLILDRNWRGSSGELDIVVMSPNEEIVAVEVKTRSSLRFGDPFDAITPEKYRKVYQLAREWISLNTKSARWRIDVILLLKNGMEFKLVHHKGLIA